VETGGDTRFNCRGHIGILSGLINLDDYSGGGGGELGQRLGASKGSRLIELDVGGCGARRLDEQPAAEAGRERVDRAIAEAENWLVFF